MKVCLITGSARRIGRAIALALHQQGWAVMLHHHTSAVAAQDLGAELNQQRPGSAQIVAGDLMQPDTAAVLVERTIAVWGRLDLLINNASCFIKTPIGQITGADWQQAFATNLQAPFFLAQAAAPFLAQYHGSIINITDAHLHTSIKDYAVYCLTKDGLNTMTKILAKELGPDIRVNAIAPGLIIWPEGREQLESLTQERLVASTTLKRQGSPDDIAKAVLFLAQDAPYITGHILVVDGGRWQ